MTPNCQTRCYLSVVLGALGCEVLICGPRRHRLMVVDSWRHGGHPQSLSDPSRAWRAVSLPKYQWQLPAAPSARRGTAIVEVLACSSPLVPESLCERVVGELGGTLGRVRTAAEGEQKLSARSGSSRQLVRGAFKAALGMKDQREGTALRGKMCQRSPNRLHVALGGISSCPTQKFTCQCGSKKKRAQRGVLCGSH
jgi:hypothetical protein